MPVEEMATPEDWNEWDRARFLFFHVRSFVSRKFPRLAKVGLNPLCREILEYRQERSKALEGRRAMMHVEHYPMCVCMWIPAVRKLSTHYQIGIYLHEFGHLGSRGGEAKAGRWVEKNFGIKIHYKGALVLEWVSREDGLRVLSATRPRRSRPSRR